MSGKCTLFQNLHITMKKKRGEYKVGRLIIDGNSVFELDEKCLQEQNIPDECEIKKYINDYQKDVQKKNCVLNKSEK